MIIAEDLLPPRDCFNLVDDMWFDTIEDACVLVSGVMAANKLNRFFARGNYVLRMHLHRVTHEKMQ